MPRSDSPAFRAVTWTRTWALGMALALGCGATPVRPASSSGPPLDLALPALGGGTLDVAMFRGKPLVITFFATWSLLGDYQLDQATKAAQALDGRVATLAVGLDPDMVPAYAAAAGLEMPVALITPPVRDGSTALGPIHNIPRTVVLDAQGRVREDRVGKVPAGDLVRVLEALLDEER